MPIESKLYWTEKSKLQPKQEKKIRKALSKRRPVERIVDTDPLKTAQIREAILKKSDIGRSQLDHEALQDIADKVELHSKQRKFLMNTIKESMPELSNREIKHLTDTTIDIPVVLEPSDKSGDKQKKFELITKLLDEYTIKNRKRPSMKLIREMYKEVSGEKTLPRGSTKHIEDRLAAREPIIEEQVDTPTADESVFRIEEDTPEVEDASEEDNTGSGLRFKRNRKLKSIRGGSFLDITKKIGIAIKNKAVDAVKDKIKETSGLDAIEHAFNLGKLLRKEYISATKGNEAVKKEEEIGGSFRYKIPKAKTVAILMKAKKHPDMRGAGIFDSLVKGFTLPLRVISRIGEKLDIPVVSNIAKGFGEVSNIMTDAAGTTPLI